jgi:hypothetical protein
MNDVSALHPYIVRYIAVKQALGRGFLHEQNVLISLDQFVARRNEPGLDTNNFARWCHGKQHLASGVLRNHMRIVRNFCLTSDKKISLTKLDLPNIQPEYTIAFLHHLEQDRHNCIATHNIRLAAIHAFFRFVGERFPELLYQAQRMLAIPSSVHLWLS